MRINLMITQTNEEKRRVLMCNGEENAKKIEIWSVKSVTCSLRISWFLIYSFRSLQSNAIVENFLEQNFFGAHVSENENQLISLRTISCNHFLKRKRVSQFIMCIGNTQYRLWTKLLSVLPADKVFTVLEREYLWRHSICNTWPVDWKTT